MFRRGAYLTETALAGAHELEVDDADALPSAPFDVGPDRRIGHRTLTGRGAPRRAPRPVAST